MPLLTGFGQKVKVKKEVLSIDKKEVGFFVKKKMEDKRKKVFAILNQQRDTLFKVSRDVAYSLLDPVEVYFYESFSVPSKKIKLNYSIGKSGYYLKPKSILRYFISKEVVDKELIFNEAKLTELGGTNNELPQDIKEVLAQEKLEMKDLDFVSEKIKDGIISLKKINSTSKTLKNIQRPNLYFFDTYEISLSNENEELKIGKVIIRYPLKSTSLADFGAKDAPPPTISPDLTKGIVFIYNLKGGRVAKLGEAPFGKLKIYNGNIIVPSLEHKLYKDYKGESIINTTTKLIDYLIPRNKL